MNISALLARDYIPIYNVGKYLASLENKSISFFKPAFGLLSEDVQSTVWSLKYFLKESWFQLATFEETTPLRAVQLYYIISSYSQTLRPSLPLLQLYKIEQEPLESTS